MPHHRRSIIAHHLLLTLHGHWPVNDPRGSGSEDFINLKCALLAPIHHVRKPDDEQPSRGELRSFLHEAQALMNFPVFWIDEAKRQVAAEVIAGVLPERGYTCYACAICSYHLHLVIRVQKDDALTMWNNFAEAVRERLRLRMLPPRTPPIARLRLRMKNPRSLIGGLDPRLFLCAFLRFLRAIPPMVDHRQQVIDIHLA